MLDKEFYLIFGKKKRKWSGLSVRVAERVPALKAGEVCIKAHTLLPASAFERQLLKTTIHVPEELVTPADIRTEVVNEIAEDTLSKLVGDGSS